MPAPAIHHKPIFHLQVLAGVNLLNPRWRLRDTENVHVERRWSCDYADDYMDEYVI